MSEVIQLENILPVFPLDDLGMRRKGWIITLFSDEYNQEDGKEQLKSALKTLREYGNKKKKTYYVSQAIGQMEQCPTTDRLHIHFAFILDSKDHAPARKLMELFSNLNPKGIKAVDFNYMDLIFTYVSKSQSRVAGPVYYGWKDPETGKLSSKIPKALYQDKWVFKPKAETTQDLDIEKLKQRGDQNALKRRVERNIRANEKLRETRIKKLTKDLQDLSIATQIDRLTHLVKEAKTAYTQAYKDYHESDQPTTLLTEECNKKIYEISLLEYAYIEAEIRLFSVTSVRQKMEEELKYWEEYTRPSEEPNPPNTILECPFTLPRLPPEPPLYFLKSKTHRPPIAIKSTPEDRLLSEHWAKLAKPHANIKKLEIEYNRKLAAMRSKTECKT